MPKKKIEENKETTLPQTIPGRTAGAKPVKLHVPKITTAEATAMFRDFSKSNMMEAVGNVVLILRSNGVTFSKTSDPATADAVVKMVEAESFSKCLRPTFDMFYAVFAKEPENIVSLMKVDASLRKTYDILMESDDITLANLERKTKIKFYVAANNSWNRKYLFDLRLAGTMWSMDDTYFYDFKNEFRKHMQLNVSPAARRDIAKYLYGKDSLLLEPVDNLPKGSVTAEFLADMPDDLVKLAGLGMAGKLLDSESITRTKLTSSSKKLKCRDFPADAATNYCVTRGEMLELAYINYTMGDAEAFFYPGLEKDLAEYAVKDLADDIVGASVACMIPEFKGITAAWAYHTRIPAVVEIINKILKSCEQQKWYSLKNFYGVYRIIPGRKNTDRAEPRICIFSRSEFSNNKNRIASREDGGDYWRKRKSVSLWGDLTMSFIPNWLKLMASLGLVDLAFDISHKDREHLDGISHLRLTPLGRYALGLSKDYESVSKNVGEEMFDFDDNGILTSLVKDNPLDLFLEKISEKIGGSRYRITPQSFVMNAQNREEVEENINKFEKMVMPKPSPRWKEIFKEAKQRANILVKVGVSYSLFCLNPEVPGLLDFVMTNPDIRRDCLRAENHMLLVPSRKLLDIEKIFKDNGYLL